jgi:hypothetical protein
VGRLDELPDEPVASVRRYQPSPALVPSERAVTEFRRWASQIHAEPVG